MVGRYFCVSNYCLICMVCLLQFKGNVCINSVHVQLIRVYAALTPLTLAMYTGIRLTTKYYMFEELKCVYDIHKCTVAGLEHMQYCHFINEVTIAGWIR